MMETETLTMTSRRKMVLRPLSTAGLQYKEHNSSAKVDDNQPIKPSALLVSPNTEKKKILLQESDLPETPTVQRNKVLLSYSANNSLFDTDDSDSDESTTNDEKTQQSNKHLYHMIFMFSCWVAIQYWMITVAGFGAVFFAFSALIAIYLNTTKTDKKSNTLSAYSVFNPQCTPIHGSADPKQLERELIFGL